MIYFNLFFFFSCPHSSPSVEMRVGIDGALCWMCEIGWVSFSILFLPHRQHWFIQGTFWGFIASCSSCMILYCLRRRGFSKNRYFNVVLQVPNCARKLHFPLCSQQKKYYSFLIILFYFFILTINFFWILLYFFFIYYYYFTIYLLFFHYLLVII